MKVSKLSEEFKYVVESETVNDVGEGVPICEVLGVFATVSYSMPEFNIAAFTDKISSERKLGKGGN